MKRFFSVFAAAVLLLSGAFAVLPVRAAGTATVSVEAFSVGGGYLAQPAELETDGSLRASVAVLSLLAQNGLTAFYGGTPENGFYLAYVANGAAAGSFNGYRCASSSYPPASPRALSFATAIDPAVKAYLADHADYFDETDYETNFSGYLGEFVYTNGSGWMYSLNGAYLQKDMASVSLQPGDTLTLKYTLWYGADVGGAEPAVQAAFDAAMAQAETTAPPETETASEPVTNAPPASTEPGTTAPTATVPATTVPATTIPATTVPAVQTTAEETTTAQSTTEESTVEESTAAESTTEESTAADPSETDTSDGPAAETDKPNGKTYLYWVIPAAAAIPVTALAVVIFKKYKQKETENT